MADQRVSCVLDHFNSEQSVWASTRVRIKSLTSGMVTVPVCYRIFHNPPHLTLFSLPENETAVIRYDYGDPALGTCQETIQGGNHFRYWVQNGSQRNSSAVFMAFSYEHSLQGAFLNFIGIYYFQPYFYSLSIEYTDDMSRSHASNFYQRTILSSSMGIILAGKSFPGFITPRAVQRAYIHLILRLLT